MRPFNVPLLKLCMGICWLEMQFEPYVGINGIKVAPQSKPRIYTHISNGKEMENNRQKSGILHQETKRDEANQKHCEQEMREKNVNIKLNTII